MTVDLWDEIGSKEVNLVRSTTATPAISSTIHESFNNLETMPFRANIAPYPPQHPGQMPMYGQPQTPVQQYGGSQYGQGEISPSPGMKVNQLTDCTQSPTIRRLLMGMANPSMAITTTLPQFTGLLRCMREVPWAGRRECLYQDHQVALSKACLPEILLETVLEAHSDCKTPMTRSESGLSCKTSVYGLKETSGEFAAKTWAVLASCTSNKH